MNEIIEDALGAVLWVKENIRGYGGDPGRIAVTGDSAGGHLAAMVVNSTARLRSTGFTSPPLGFNPSYLPRGTTVEQIAVDRDLAVQAAVLSYGAFDIHQLAVDGFERITNPFWWGARSLPRGMTGKPFNVADHPERYRAVSPIHTIPPVSARRLPPQLLTVGTTDPIVKPEAVRAYRDALVAAGQNAAYWEHDGRSHAFLDRGFNLFLGTRFVDDAPPALDVMIDFLAGVFER